MGRFVLKLLKSVFIVAFALLLAGCAASETSSLVSKDDIPAGKYKKIAVFIENLNESEQTAAEKIVVSTFQNSGVNATSGSAVFTGRGKLSEKAKAAIVQNEFDAVLYLKMVEKGVTEEVVSGASHNGGMIVFQKAIIPGFNASFATDIGTDGYILKPDGSVYQPMLALKTKADLQDTKSAKQVWEAETIASVNAKFSSMESLFTQASNQIVEKMRADGAI